MLVVQYTIISDMLWDPCAINRYLGFWDYMICVYVGPLGLGFEYYSI